LTEFTFSRDLLPLDWFNSDPAHWQSLLCVLMTEMRGHLSTRYAVNQQKNSQKILGAQRHI
jgi:hypothetical protein